MENLKIHKVSFKLLVYISVSPVDSLDDGACHKVRFNPVRTG